MPFDEDTQAAAGESRPRFCTNCGAALADVDRFCPECGADIAKQAEQAAVVPEDEPGAGGTAFAPIPVPATGEEPPSRRRQRGRRPWYRRPLIVAPLAILCLLLVAGGVMAYRTYRAFGEVNQLSTPPPEISGVSLGGDEEVTIDTSAAQRAIDEWEATRAARADTPDEETVAAPPTEVATDVPATTAPSTDVPPTSEPAEDDDDIIGPSGSSGTRATEATTPTERATESPTEIPTESGSGAANLVVEDEEPVGTGVNILLMGVDSREGEAIDIGVRPDSLGILNLNEETGTCRILAVPRDSRVEIPGYGQSKVNHALAVGGIPFEMLVLENYLGITIDHYALVDFSAVVAVVDAFGGVTVDNPEAFEAGGHTFAAGEIQLNGEQALAYSRYRGGPDGDFGRVAKQQQVLRALLDEATESNLVNLVPQIWNLLDDHFRTDYGMFDLISTGNEFRGSCTSETLETETIPGDVQTLPDDMMSMNLSFVVSDPADVNASVQWLLTGDAESTGAGPDGTAPASPVATPEADGAVLRVWRHDQG